MLKTNVSDTMQQLKLLQCSFCRIETFSTSKTTHVAGWIAEHYVALSRCFVHIMSYVTEIVHVPDRITMVYFKLMIQSMMCFVYHIMSPFEINMTTIDNYIKCFLQSVHHFEEYSNIFKPDAPFMWYSRGIFLSLLNLPDQIEQFGSIRLYWEGSCERHIQYIKPLMTNMRNTSTYLALQLHKLQQANMLDHMMDYISDNKKHMQTYARYTNMKIYSDVASIVDIIMESEVFVCSYNTMHNNTNLAQLFCVIKCKSSSFQKVHIICDDNKGMYNNGQWYTYVTSQTLDVSEPLCSITTEDFKNVTNVIAIPLLRNVDSDIPLYAFVTETWLCRSCNGIMCLPNIAPEIILEIN